MRKAPSGRALASVTRWFAALLALPVVLVGVPPVASAAPPTVAGVAAGAGEGLLMWQISPTTASVEVNGSAALPPNGSIALPPGRYFLNASAPGYLPASLLVQVSAGATSWVNATLVATASPSLTGPALSPSTLLNGLLVDAALLVGLGALFAWVGRRPPASPSGAGTAP